MRRSHPGTVGSCPFGRHTRSAVWPLGRGASELVLVGQVAWGSQCCPGDLNSPALPHGQEQGGFFSWPLGERGSPPGPLGCGTERPNGSPGFGRASFVGPQPWRSHPSTACTSGLVPGAGGAQPHSHPWRRPVCVLLALRLGGGRGHLREISVRDDFRDASGLVPFGVCPVRQVGLSNREVFQAQGHACNGLCPGRPPGLGGAPAGEGEEHGRSRPWSIYQRLPSWQSPGLSSLCPVSHLNLTSLAPLVEAPPKEAKLKTSLALVTCWHP